MTSPESSSSASKGSSSTAAWRQAWWWRNLLRPLAWLMAGGLAAGLAGAMLVGIGLSIAYPKLPELDSLSAYRPVMPLRVYAADGTLIGEFGEEKRNYVRIHQIPPVMRNAVLAIEDARFYEHHGVDYIGILRAGLANVGDSRSQGASTITMQVARNFYLPTEKTFTRKIYEILLALKIESQLSKDQILELYMNHIFLGQRAYGFAAASEIYFGKPLKDVSIAEAAMLAGLPKAPSAYNPIRNPKRATIRQLYILDRMLENGFITADQRDEAREETLTYRRKDSLPDEARYVAEAARLLMFERYGADAYTRGLNVYTSVSLREQTAAYNALRRGLLNFDRRQSWRGPEGHVTLPANTSEWDTLIAEALEDHPASGNIQSAVVIQADPKKIKVALQSGEQLELSGEALRALGNALTDKANPKTQVKRGAIIRVMPDQKKQWSVVQMPVVEGALVALDPDTGMISAMMGGFEFDRAQFNRVTQAWRQPGSSFKPFIYSAALEKGFTPSSLINDAPLFFPGSATGSTPWEPKNYDGKFEGPMTMRRALAKSKNMVSIRLLHSIGAPFGQEWATRFGFDAERHPPYLTMALGAGTVTPLQLASGYAVFANGGYRLNPELILKVTDSDGRVLAQNRPQSRDERMRVIDARNAFITSSLLQEVTRSGTAARAQALLKRPDVYGKTGTTNDSMDAWFAGYSSHRVAVVWIGYDKPRKLGDRETGGGLSLPVWIDYMSVAIGGKPVAEIPPPEGVVNINGEWYYEEYTPATGVRQLIMEEDSPKDAPAPSSEEEKRSILDLFGGSETP
jgi:penicillin-binding protein 1A